MTSERGVFYKLLDGFSRSNYQCFVAELFASDDGTEYIVCFRPTEVAVDSPDRYKSRYTRIDAVQVHLAAKLGSLTTAIVQKLDPELRELGKKGTA